MTRFLCTLLMICACATGTVQPLPTPPATCIDVCSNMAQLDCPGARPTAAGASCEIVCTNFQRGPAPWDLLCRAVAKSCELMDQCEAGR
jgi:hypothetical protein